ncbi:esterase/lipase family protein [Aspergillus candidus]|uniref:Alpha/Beta hydrolase protein n=1 Tax=Aspergillus candidus TaxID=41067 RepID=A0A2I2F6L0_ASPCN|nr:Alpha/Beta hydrolase protein [Aspergillus candidus]PLB36253.1 Alpha/Beta hydrolase protein [Aspergillus candidus]
MTSNIRPFGLTVIHNPPETATVDIVLVHGLSGHPKDTWTSDTGTFWPADLLPHALGQSRARVLTYGYDASVQNFTDGNGSGGIHGVAETLVSSLAANRNLRGCSERPIIFICHSLGGIVVKKALIYSHSVSNKRVKHLRSVLVSTYGLIFLGTPHNVDDAGQWSMALQMLCEAILPQQLVQSSPQLIRTLSENNESIRDTNSLFADLWNKFHVCFFYETEGISLEGYKYVVVDERSAAPIIEGAERAGIAADHIHMCKFDDASATYWKFMAGILSRYCIEAPHSLHRLSKTSPMSRSLVCSTMSLSQDYYKNNIFCGMYNKT